MTVFHNCFTVIEKQKKLSNIIFGATNQLFLKSLLTVDCIIRIDKESLKDNKKDQEDVFKTFCKSYINCPVNFRNYLIVGSSLESNQINLRVLRQKLLELTLDFLEPIQAYFQCQYNVW